MEIIVIVVLAVTTVVVVLRYRLRRQKDQLSIGGEAMSQPQISETSLELTESHLPRGASTVKITDVCKSFNQTCAVDSVTFELKSGQILGLVGPNGAGKTTVIRMLMNIIMPDSGSIHILHESTHGDTDRIGYLPEERGLYRKMSAMDTLEYMGRLKGMPTLQARKAADQWLQRLGMSDHKTKKIEQLSKGMGQIIQLAATVIHDPEIVILDEPFSGLDPVNREMLKKIILELKGAGRTIMLSTHQMNEVEELCDRVLMINRGKVVLYGGLQEIRSRYRNNSVFLEYNGSITDLPGVDQVKDYGSYVELFMREGASANQVLGSLIERGVTIDRFEVSTPSLHDIFIRVATEKI